MGNDVDRALAEVQQRERAIEDYQALKEITVSMAIGYSHFMKLAVSGDEIAIGRWFS